MDATATPAVYAEIAIVHRWSGHVLYRTTSALDRRAAVVDAVLRGADLRGAVLRDADLRGAVLRGAVLSDADLRGADLRGADLRGAVLVQTKADVFAVLDRAPDEVAGLVAKLEAGEVDGTCYEGKCACLVGTLANLRGCAYNSIPDLRPDSSRSAERWFLAIDEGDTQASSPIVALTVEWIREWQAARAAAITPA